MLDGNIYLLDLVTGQSQQLTTDSDNRWPTWSADGRYLLYTHAKGEEQSDLYIWDLEKETVPRLLVENACCAAWKADDERIAYLALNGENVALNTIQADGSGQATLLSKVDYERGVSPKGNLRWLPSTQSNGLLIPLEIVAGSAQNGLAVQTWLFQVDEQTQTLTPFHAIAADCSLLNADVGLAQDQSTALAMAFEGTCEHTTHNKGILLAHPAEAAPNQELPGLAYPSFSPDSRYLVAERYAESADYTDAKPTGLVLHNLADNTEVALLDGGTQPAWRPASPVDPAVARFAQPGERVVTIEPALTWQEATYRVHALTTGESKLITPAIFSAPNAEALTKRGISALIVTQDGAVVNDAATLRQVFLLYTAAYLLYEQPPVEFDPKIANELGKVLDNPIFQAVAVSELWKTRRAQTTEALRTLLTDQVSAKTTLDPLLEQAFATTPKQLETALDAFGAAVDNKAAYDAVLLGLKPDLAAAYQVAADTAKGRQIELQFLRLAARLLFISHLQAERANWLATYVDAFPNGAGALDRDQIRAAATAMEETKKSSTQRANLAGDFLIELGSEQVLSLTGAAATKAATALVTHVSEKAGVEITANAVAGVLSAAAFGAALGNLLYGSDELYADFMLARRADELRATFRSGRTAVQTNAATAKQQAQDQLVYNGDLAAQFRAAYLLETLAAVQAQRAYADGVTATFRLPNGVELLNWLRGEDWQQAVDGLRKNADETELELLKTIGSPAYLDDALKLARNRTSQLPKIIIGTQIASEFSKQHPEWTSYIKPAAVYDLLVQKDIVWAATTSGVVRWDTGSGQYTRLTAQDGLAQNGVYSIAQGNDGSIWFATIEQLGKVSQLAPDRSWATFTKANGLVSNEIFKIVKTTDGSLWFCSFGNGVSRLDSKGNWTTFTTANGLLNNDVSSIIQSDDGSLWFGTRSGISRLDANGKWTNLTRADGLVSEHVQAIFQSADSMLWFGTDNGISRLDTSGHWATFTVSNGLVSNNVTAIIQRSDGSLWFGTDQGVSRLATDGTWRTFTDVNGLADNYIRAIRQSPDGSLWFATTNETSGLVTTQGISRLDVDGNWTVFVTSPTNEGLMSLIVQAILQSFDGAVWFGTNDGVSRLNPDGSWTTFTTANGLAFNAVSSINQSQDGSLWFNTYSNEGGIAPIISRLNPNGSWTNVTQIGGLGSVRRLYQSADGTIWIFSDFGVSRLDSNGNWMNFTFPKGYMGAIYSAFQSTDGTLWLTGMHVIMNRLDVNGQWTDLSTIDGLSEGADTIFQSRDGAMWFGTRKGVTRLDTNGQWTTFTTANGLVNNWVDAIFQTSDGAMWFSSGKGMSRLGVDGHWTDFADDNLHGIHTQSMLEDIDHTILVVGTDAVSRLDSEGRWTLVRSQAEFGYIYTVFQTVDGVTWFGSSNGVSRYQPQQK